MTSTKSKTIKTPNRTCQNCGAGFFAYPSAIRRGRGKYCSPECYGLSLRNQVDRTCESCGAPFQVVPSYIALGRGKYCSQDCKDEAQRTGITVVDRVCEVCGVVFQAEPNSVKSGGGQFCSRECFYESMRDRVDVDCGICGKGFYTKPSYIALGRGKFCSVECRYEAQMTGTDVPCIGCGELFYATRSQVERGVGLICSWNCAFDLAIGSDPTTWASLRVIGPTGYARIYYGQNHWVDEHRLKAEMIYGDLEGLEVHHKNRDPGDNSPANLQVVTPEEHAEIHRELNRLDRLASLEGVGV